MVATSQFDPAVAPSVSIVVPTYNSGSFLRDSIPSILSQTYSDFELIVVDDASTDGSESILAEFDDARLRCLRQPVNSGIFPTLQAGIEQARGPLIGFYHADDVYDREILAREVAYLEEHPDVGAVFALDRFVDPEGVEYGRVELPPEFGGGRPLGFGAVMNGVLRYGNVFIRGQTSLVRRKVYDVVGPYDARYDLRADLDMWLRIVAQTPIAILDEHLMSYRWGHSNSSARYDRLRREPELTFEVLDAALRRGGDAVAEPDALREYEARRCEDLLIVTANRYALAELSAARAMLRDASVAAILSARRVRRPRLVALWALLHLATRLPRIGLLGAGFARRFGRGR